MRAALLASALAFLPATAHALVRLSPEIPTEIAVLGTISPFDAITFEGLLNDAEQQGRHIVTVLLESAGGDIGLAMQIAANIERRHLDTRTGMGGLCSSACVLPLSAGHHVHIAAGSHVGVHQARTPAGEAAWGSSYDMAAYLASRHVAHSVTVKLLETSSDARAWLNTAEMRESGWTVDEPATAWPASRWRGRPPCGGRTFVSWSRPGT